MPRQIVVIGAGVGGLSAAIHCRLHGFDVLVLEQRDTAGGKAAGIEVEGYRLDPGPSIVILKGIYEALFERAGRSMDDYLRFTRLDPFTRVCFEGEPVLDLPSEREACLDVLSDRFPADGERLRWLMRRADGVYSDVWRTVFARPFDRPWQIANYGMIRLGMALGGQKPFKHVVDDWFKSPGLRAFFYGFPSYGGQTYASVAPGAFLIPYLMLSEGVYYPEGGIAAIPEALLRLARDLGVEVRFKSRVTGLKREAGRISAVLTDDEAFPCEAAVCNLDRYTAGAWLDRTFDLPPSLSYFTVHLGVRKQLDLRCHTLFVPNDFETGFEQLYRKGQFPESPIVYVNATSVVDPDTAPANATNVFAVSTSPAMTDELDWDALANSAKGSVLQTLARCGLDIASCDLDFERVQTPMTFAERDGSYRGSLYGADERHRLFGMMPQRNWDEEFANLYYCGGSVQPGAGLPMVLLSGKFAADRLARKVG